MRTFKLFPPILLAVATCSVGCGMDTRGVMGTVELVDYEIVEVDGAKRIAGTLELSVDASIDQTLVVDRLDVRVTSPSTFGAFDDVNVDVLGDWPIDVAPGHPVRRSFRFDAPLPPMCAGQLVGVSADVTLLGDYEATYAVHGWRELSDVDVVVDVDQLPWSWTVEATLTYDRDPLDRVLAPTADDVAWSITPLDELVRVTVRGAEIRSAPTVLMVEPATDDDAVYTFELEPTGASFKRRDEAGVVWSVPAPDGAGLVVALAEGIVVRGRSDGSTVLGGRRVEPGTFVALLDGTSGGARAAYVDPSGSEIVFDGRRSPDGGFVAIVTDVYEPYGDRAGTPRAGGSLVSHDASLQRVARSMVGAEAIAVGPDGTTYVAGAGDIAALDGRLVETWRTQLPCADFEEPSLIALEGGVLVASTERLGILDGSGVMTVSMQLDRQLDLVRRGGLVMGAWNGDVDTKVARLDLARLVEVRP